MTTITPDPPPGSRRERRTRRAATGHGRIEDRRDRVRRGARCRRGRGDRRRRRRCRQPGRRRRRAGAPGRRGAARPPRRPRRRPPPPPRCLRCTSRRRGRCPASPARSVPAPIPTIVRAYQQRLVDLHFDPGPEDGNYGAGDAVRGADAAEDLRPPAHRALGAAEALALAAFQYPAPLQPNGEGNRTEIDVTKQVLTLYENYQPRLDHHDVHRIRPALLLQLAAREPDPPHLRGRDDAVGPLHLHPLGQGLGQVAARSAVPAVLLQRRHRGARVPRGPDVGRRRTAAPASRCTSPSTTRCSCTSATRCTCSAASPRRSSRSTTPI